MRLYLDDDLVGPILAAVPRKDGMARKSRRMLLSAG
jgi:hypothetical protein